MCLNPESIQTCLVNDVAEGGKGVLECVLSYEGIQLQD